MRHYFYLIGLLLIISCNSTSQQTESQKESEGIKPEDFGETECIYSRQAIRKDHHFPFDESDKIEIISYQGVVERPSDFNVIVDGKVIVPNIKETITLDQTKTDSLFSILFDYRTKRMGDGIITQACYVPRHSIVFYKNEIAIAYIEICFQCERYETSENLGFYSLDFCSDKWCMLLKYFKWVGINQELDDKVCK
jgi:hypothetical protein